MALHVVKYAAKLALATVLLLCMVVACNGASTQGPSYGKKTRYSQGQPLVFPDVTLEFMGKRESPPSSDYPRAITFYDFKASQGSQEQLVSWTAGTGDIGPTVFVLGTSRFALELAMSDELGALDADELVLWREVIRATKAPIASPIPTRASPPQEAQETYERGFVQFAAGLPEEAAASLTQAITLCPTYVEAYQLRGNAYGQLGRYDLARADYQQVLDLNPQPEMQATVTAALQEIAQAETIPPTPAPTLTSPTPGSLPSVTITLGQSFTLALGQHGRLDSAGLGVRFYEVVEDTRCPRQVDCESQGWARIAIFVWKTNVEPVEFFLSTDPATDRDVVLYDEYQVRLLGLDPYPETADPGIAPEDYRATFAVSK